MSQDFNFRLLGSLSAVESRSGEAIAEDLGCSRTAVWKHIEELRSLGVGVDAVAGQGYRLSEALELLDREHIAREISPAARGIMASLTIHATLDSTNAEMQRQPLDKQHASVVFAERQTAGRGRRGRHWHSPFARNIYLSLGWRFDTGVSELGCLPLVVALAACDALQRAGVSGHVIKWPNDLLLGGRKFGGCLVEVQGDASGPCVAVMGLGINVNLPQTAIAEEVIDQPWTDVARYFPGISRHDLAVSVLDSLLVSVDAFQASGFGPFLERWRALDGLDGREIVLIHAQGQACGKARGISDRGGLFVQTSGETREYLAGEVSVRPSG